MYWLKEEKKSRVPLVVGLMALLVCLGASSSWALGTPAGTMISLTATVNYTVSSFPSPLTASATESFSVLEVIDATVVCQDAAAVQVNTPQTGAFLTFLLTNTGNGPESFGLTFDPVLAGDDFDPAAGAVWLETNGTAGLQTSGGAPDTVYTTGLNDPSLAADAAQLIYLRCDIPAGQVDGDLGQVRLTAAALTPGAAGAEAGTELAGAGVGGIDAMVGRSGAERDAVGSFEVTAVEVVLTKSILQIADPLGGSQPYPGAVVTYRIIVEVMGGGTAEGLVISDLIPADMTYLAGSITLDGVAQTDADDPAVDSSDFSVTVADTVTVNLGNIVAPATRSIDFQATIN